MRLLFLAAVAFWANAAHAENIPRSEFGYGNWKGGAYTNDVTGEFSHCAISAPFVSGDTLIFSVNRQATVTVGVANPNFNFRAGETFPVTIYVDRRAPFFGQAEALNTDFAVLEIDDFSRALRSFQKGYGMRIETPNGYGRYDLTGTYRALEMAYECARRHINYVGSPSRGSSNNSEMDRTVLFQVATEITSELGINGFSFFSKAQLEERGYSTDMVYWAANETGVEGAVFVVNRGDIASLRETDAEDAKFLADGCMGDFATSARELDFEDVDVREIRAVCVVEDEKRETYVTKMPLGNSVLYTLLVFVDDAQIEKAQNRQIANERAALRAASYVED